MKIDYRPNPEFFIDVSFSYFYIYLQYVTCSFADQLEHDESQTDERPGNSQQFMAFRFENHDSIGTPWQLEHDH